MLSSKETSYQRHTIYYTISATVTQVLDSKQLTNETFWIRGKQRLTGDSISNMYYAGRAVIYNYTITIDTTLAYVLLLVL